MDRTNEKMDKFFGILRDKSENEEDPLVEWRVLDIEPDYKESRCICGTEICQNFVIENMINKKRLIVGSKCVEKWQFTMLCQGCNKQLKNVANRLKEHKWVCAKCMRSAKKRAKLEQFRKEERIKKLGNYILYHSGKYYQKHFHEVIEDIQYSNWLYNLESNTKTLAFFKEYVELVCEIVEEEV